MKSRHWTAPGETSYHKSEKVWYDGRHGDRCDAWTAARLIFDPDSHGNESPRVMWRLYYYYPIDFLIECDPSVGFQGSTSLGPIDPRKDRPCCCSKSCFCEHKVIRTPARRFRYAPIPVRAGALGPCMYLYLHGTYMCTKLAFVITTPRDPSPHPHGERGDRLTHTFPTLPLGAAKSGLHAPVLIHGDGSEKIRYCEGRSSVSRSVAHEDAVYVWTPFVELAGRP